MRIRHGEYSVSLTKLFVMYNFCQICTNVLYVQKFTTLGEPIQPKPFDVKEEIEKRE